MFETIRKIVASTPLVVFGSLKAENESLYPALAQVAHLILNIPVVLTGCDAVFSAEANKFTSRRLSTNFNNGMRQLALKHNLRKWELLKTEEGAFEPRGM